MGNGRNDEGGPPPGEEGSDPERSGTNRSVPGSDVASGTGSIPSISARSVRIPDDPTGPGHDLAEAEEVSAVPEPSGAPQTVPSDSPPDPAPEDEGPPDSAPPAIPSAAGGEPPPLPRRSAKPQPVLPGHVIADRYEILSVLGEGGMGIVYRCRDDATGNEVAIKRVIPPESKLADEYVMWFYKEARALASVDHPAIVRALDFGQLVDGSPFLVMQLVGGVSLHDLSYGKLSWPLIWSIIDQVLGALAHAHARGIVHGDLKPSNVLVEEMKGEPPKVHILDFGLAWLKQDPHDERLDGAEKLEFAPHAGAGTPGYMAPEQIQHEMHHVCGATDLYALGCILYKLLTGKAPFSGDAKQLLKLHAFEPIPERELTVKAPEAVRRFLMRMLEKKPWDRWEFVGEARSVWSHWRPSPDTPGKAWRFPKVRRTESPPAQPEPTRRTGVRRPNRTLEASKERAPGLLSIRPPPLVGRDDIRQALREICDDVIEGDGAPHRLAILVGSAGVGKSRIVEWLSEVVHEEGSMVPLRSRYRAMRGPLDGMLGAVTQYYSFERADRDTIERSLMDRWKVAREDKNGRAWVAGAAEWLRPMPPGETRLGPTGMRFTLDTLEVRRAVIRYTLKKISGGRPLLFWLDDLHHGSEATFEGLKQLHEDDPDQRIVMVATVRSEDVNLGTPAAELLRSLREALDGVVMEVNALDPETTAQLVRASLPLDDDSALEAARRSRGNPLFALQQLHAWALNGSLEIREATYCVPAEVLALRPQTTKELWDSRVRAMPDAHRVAAFAAATVGSDVRREVLHVLFANLGMVADSAIVSLQNAEVLLPRGPGRYIWPHALLQEHLLELLAERKDAPRIFRLASDALARHPQGDSRRIVRLRVANLMRAGDAAAAAALLFDFVSRSWSGAREPRATLADLELLEGRLEGEALATKHRWQAEALRHTGNAEQATEHAELARRAFEELGDRENMAHCLRLLGHLASERGQSAEGLVLVGLGRDIFAELGHVRGQAQCATVGAEIEYLLGNYADARAAAARGQVLFAELGEPLGRGQCLLLESWVDHSEGNTERARALTMQARSEFEGAGYRLGLAQADISLAHVEHRLLNYYSAEKGSLDALEVFQTLRNPRGEAGCERLLSMIGLDTDDSDMAELHAERAVRIFRAMNDPWGILEATLLHCQAMLAQGNIERADELFEAARETRVEEAEPRQHFLLTEAWLAHARGDEDRAFEALDAASDVFSERSQCGDHTPHLLGRFRRWSWPDHARDRLEAWYTLVSARAKRAGG